MTPLAWQALQDIRGIVIAVILVVIVGGYLWFRWADR